MRIRFLLEKDTQGMLEWMHDLTINQYYRFDAMSMTVEKVREFIKKKDKNSVHYAVVNEADEYCGTVSLKNIDKQNSKAEYAIVLRKCVQGTGMSTRATDEILKVAFNQYFLHKVYLNVFSSNMRANNFYKRYGFQYEGTFRDDVKLSDRFCDLSWYSILDVDFKNKMKNQFLLR